MWIIMMIGMMLPSATPMILMFAGVQKRRRELQRPYVSTTLFALGYLIVWSGFSLLCTFVQWLLHAAAVISSTMTSRNAMFSGVVLIACGVFQFTPYKSRCLTHCRSPLQFIMTSWREGKLGALRMGLHHGFYCAGCCWLLMALLFVLGVMNLWWVAAITLYVLIEKIVPQGIRLSRYAGALLIVWGAVIPFL
jgi:predicted metal-binding membrane protein